jgi:adenylyltransferase/sulfurtransferase
VGEVDSLSGQELERYSRQIVLKDIGYDGQLKLRKGKVCVVGLGGLGCTIAVQLTAMGIGLLRLVDRDVVECSNLHRQHLYDVDSLGYPKVEIAVKKLSKLNPDVKLEPVPSSLSVNNAEEILDGVDVVVDGLDRIGPRYAINRACVGLGIPYVFGAAIAVYGNLSTIIPGKTPCLECFFPNLENESLPTCGTVGVHPSLLGIISSLEVSEAVRILIGKTPHLAGKLLYCDLYSLDFRKISIARSEDCPVCSVKLKEELQPMEQKIIEEVCGRGGKRVFVITPTKNLELDLEELCRYLNRKNLTVKVKAKLGVTFDYSEAIMVSILKSGVAILEGAKEEKEALETYKRILAEGLGILSDKIGL